MNAVREKPQQAQDTAQEKRTLWRRLWSIIWERMEFRRIGKAVVSIFRAAIRLVSFPFQWLDGGIEALRRLLKPEVERLKGPSKRQVYTKMTAAIIDGILENKNTAAGSRIIKQVKSLFILLLEFASAITTTIGMLIVASDISPMIAFIWSAVVQIMAGILSAVRGKWNNIILAVCMLFSIGSDYVCYINAVYPYDVYLEGQYVEFKNSYDVVWEYSLNDAQEYFSVEAGVNMAFGQVESDFQRLQDIYKEENLTNLENELQTLNDKLITLDPEKRIQTGTRVTIDPNTGERIWTPEYTVVANTEYTDTKERRDALDTEVKALREKIDAIMAAQTVYDGMNSAYSGNAKSYTLQLFEDIKSTDITEMELAAKEAELAEINRQLYVVYDQLAVFEEIQTAGSERNMDLMALKTQNDYYIQIEQLRMPAYDELEREVNEVTNAYDKVISFMEKELDSEFIKNAMDMKEQAEQISRERYTRLMETIAGKLQSDTTLQELIYGSAEGEQSNGVLPLETAYKNIAYEDPLTKALDRLLHFWQDPFTVLTRLIYACLADALVLLIGFSMRRKNTAVYRIHNRKDLTDEEPRLISEAFYNLAFKKETDLINIEGVKKDIDQGEMVRRLIMKLEKFREQFEAESFLRDTNLDSSYSMVCKEQEKQNVLQTEYKELMSLLLTLKYIRPISMAQYEFVKDYKLNKATIEPDNLKEQVEMLTDKHESRYYYLMTEGFALYLSEKINDLYQCVEAECCKDEIKRHLKK